jgi:hypothetical protein
MSDGYTVGDVVMLRSGSNPMTVVEVHGRTTTVVYADNIGKGHRLTVDCGALMPIGPTAEVPAAADPSKESTCN